MPASADNVANLLSHFLAIPPTVAIPIHIEKHKIKAGMKGYRPMPAKR
jgi:hypothetical protein